MALLVWTSVGAAISALVWLGLRDAFAQPVFERLNHRRRPVPVGAGVIIVLATIVIEAGAVAVGAVRGTPLGAATRSLTLILVGGFGLLGLFDDVAGAGDDRGFAGHLAAMCRGRLTTGGVKLLGGAALALAVVGTTGEAAPGRLVVDGALIALAANLANLFDRAPGRVIKVGVVAFAVLVALSAQRSELSGPAVVVGASLGLLWPDLRERLMLGDAGANPLGAALGLGVVVGAGEGVRLVVALVLLVLNVVSERVSFSKVIDATPPLRWLDHLGRNP